MADKTASTTPAASIERPRSSPLRWGIAVVLLLVAAWASWHSYRVFRQRSVVDHIDELGGVVTYDFEDTDPDYRDTHPDAPSFLTSVLGNDYTQDIIEVNLRTTDRTSLSDDDLNRVSTLPAVRTLAISHGGDITDEGLQVLAKMQTLEKLTLANLPNVTDAGLAVIGRLPKLRKLELAMLPKISDKGLQPLAELKQLRQLIVAKCPIDGSGWQHLQPASLTLLEATSCKVNDAALEHLKGASAVEELSLSNNALLGDGLVHVAGLGKLVRLRLSDNEKLDPAAAMPHLKNMTALELVNLRGTKFDRAAGEELAKALPKCDITIDAGNYDPERGEWYLEDAGKQASNE
jgi:hypothetical protein